MRFQKAFVPAGGIWSSPFVRWQGSLSAINSIDLAVDLTQRALGDRGIDPSIFSRIVLGQTIPQERSFYAPSEVAARIGAPGISGPLVVQACATSAACIESAAAGVEDGQDEAVLVVATDRLSNGPLLIFPSSDAPGGEPRTEQWVRASFERDPWAGVGPLHTAEAVAREEGIDRAELDDVTLLRYAQYGRALEDDRAFQRRYFVPVTVPQGRRGSRLVTEDEGVVTTSADALARLKPVLDDGVITYGMQTHPADGTAGMILMTESRARAMSGGKGVVQILASASARVEKGRMPKAPVPAARRALDRAGLTFHDLHAITTHNPFTVNDVYFARQTGVAIDTINEYGSSLVWGHPQGPTGLRAIAELVETLRVRGGGYGLFTGCAAGDMGMAIVLSVDD